jgi:hypothetical protein
VTPAEPALPDPDDIPAVSAESLVDGEPAATASDGVGRWYPSTPGGVFYLAVLAVTLTGLGLVLTGAWRPGMRLVGVSLIVAAMVRLALSNERAGMLAVRHKAVDAGLLTTLGVLLMLLATSIPNQPG